MSGTIINNPQRLVPGLIEKVAPKPTGGSGNDEGSFADIVKDLVNSVNDLHSQSADAQQAFLNGEPIELHEVMIKAEEAGIATELLLEIRNKLVSAYNDIVRMPM